ncbi:hypothetical protein L195_g061424, partial [Trifolium pratense]
GTNNADFNDDTIVVQENTKADNQMLVEGTNSDSEEDITISIEPVQEWVPETQLELNVVEQSTTSRTFLELASTMSFGTHKVVNFR